jgi:hypothetical protein
VSFVEVCGELAPDFPAFVRWEDGEWTGDNFALQSITQAILLDCFTGPDGPIICQSPTGPCWPVSSPLGARLLAVEPFKRILSIESDIYLPELENVPGRVYGPLAGPRSGQV